ncbi:unnamed protein product [Pleuronectes platessa]|uniref:Uncharacterized protein n=1 Tax=Pleuronectes platessa TaxID=8262 RepID=A0A9N7Z9V5_PLEPL|nr:unnamed protein product [Pleuronectes platessa]
MNDSSIVFPELVKAGASTGAQHIGGARSPGPHSRPKHGRRGCISGPRTSQLFPENINTSTSTVAGRASPGSHLVLGTFSPNSQIPVKPQPGSKSKAYCHSNGLQLDSRHKSQIAAWKQGRGVRFALGSKRDSSFIHSSSPTSVLVLCNLGEWVRSPITNLESHGGKQENIISGVRRSRLTAGQRASTGLDADPQSSAETDSSRQNKTWKTKMTWHRAATDEEARMNLTGGEARRLAKARGMMEGAYCSFISHWRQKSKKYNESLLYQETGLALKLEGSQTS